MNKQEFLLKLREGLSGIPKDDVEGRLTFYEELLDDSMEEGLTEEEAVERMGTVDEIVAQVLSEIPLTKLVKERVKPKRTLKTWEIVLIILGFPVWLPLVIAGAAVMFSVYVVLWSLIISLWAVELSFIASALGSAVIGVIYLIKGAVPFGLMLLSASLILAGLSIFLFFGCKAATLGTVVLTKKIALGIKSLFVRKDNTK